ncbi:MAG: pectate lyase [Armatimonadota bacterium]|nr:pectate lyase [Armatimonadota bacterium]
MTSLGAYVLVAMTACASEVAGGQIWDADLYQHAGRALRAAVDSLAEDEVALGRFHATGWGKARTHIGIYLSAHRVTGADKYLDYATVPADWLVAARQPSGGYAHTPFIHDLGSQETFPTYVTFRDARDRSAIDAILAVYDATGDETYLQAAMETADFLLEAQYDCGAWPSVWPPPESGWLRLPMLNDYVTISQTRVLLAVYRRTGEERYLDGVRKTGDFFVQWQLPEPTPGWAQQYNFDGTPAWGRAFEPPSACGLPSAHAINLLIDIHLATGDERYTDPIPAALAWLERSKTGPNEWSRFYEPETGRPIYAASHDERDIRYDREVLYEGYAQFGDWGVARFAARWEQLQELGREGLIEAESAPPTAAELAQRITDLEPQVRQLVEADGLLGAYPEQGAGLDDLAGAVRTVADYLSAVQSLREAGT